MSAATIEERVNSVARTLLQASALEEAFTDVIVHSKANQQLQRQSSVDVFGKFWQNDVSQENLEIALRYYVRFALSQCSSKRVETLLDMLEEMVGHNILSPRLICDALVGCDLLNPTGEGGEKKWRLAFALIRRIVGGVDYKGCRDLLRAVLEKAQQIPANGSQSTLDMVNSVYEVVEYIMDRNACLLPSYFAVNEITKLFPEDKPWAHWKLGQLLSTFVQSFRPSAQMLSISGRSHLLPVVCHSNAGMLWKLNPLTLRFPLNGPLPYDKELYEAQVGLLRYVLEQPYSRELVCSILSLNKQVKQRCTVLEEQLVDLVILAMQRSETGSDTDNEDGGSNQLLWQHLSSQVIYFVLFQFASFPHMVTALYEKLKGQKLRKGRDHLMWVLLQFISGSIQKNALEDFLPVMKLYDLLYPEKDPLPLPDVNRASCTHKMAVTCIWIHLNKKAQSDSVRLQRPIPQALSFHIDFLRQILHVKNIPMKDYKIALLCNAYSTNPEYFALPMGILVESIYGREEKRLHLPGNITAHSPTEPLRMDVLDSLTVHAKMSLIHSIGTRIIRLASQKSTVALAPALVETYSRLLVYMEIESLGIKGFISQLLPSVFKSNAWGILHTLLEMFSYRLHHIQPHYRVQLLSHLHSLAAVPQTNQAQLHLCVESTALRLIMGLGSQEVHPQLSRVYNEQNKTVLISQESEELNRALVLTLARAMHITGSETISGSWCKEILQSIMAATPHGWSTHTLACFPPFLQEFYAANPVTKEDKTTITRNIDAEYRRWKSMASEVELINHFSSSTNYFLCVLWRSQLEDHRIAPTAYKVLERIGPRGLSKHLRMFVEYLIARFSASSTGSAHLNQCVEALCDLMWKCNIITIDRVILALCMHCLEGNEAHINCFIIQFLLLKSQEFRNRVTEFSQNSPEHWKQTNWHEKHMAFHTKFPEKFFYEGIQDVSTQQNQHPYLPIYFSNVCLRFIPVFDILIHRFLEITGVQKNLVVILDHLGSIYKFHDRPVTYLYNTLHYYEKKLRGAEGAKIKRKLVGAIIGSFNEIRTPSWCLTDDYNDYLMLGPSQESHNAHIGGHVDSIPPAGPSNPTGPGMNWIPDRDYYIKLIGRLVNTIAGQSPFPTCDWRFNEFPNAAAHALHACCVELMALPATSSAVGHALLDIVLKGASQIPRDKIMYWMNAIGLVLTSLPDSYWTVIHEATVDVLSLPTLAAPLPSSKPFQMLNFSTAHNVMGETPAAYLLAQCHAVWQHASIGQLSHLPGFIKEKLKPLIRTEEQYLFLCHLVGPFLSRFHAERTKCLLDITVDLYESLENVDKAVSHMQHMDPITDFLYHIKYMFIGDGVKNDVEKVIKNLKTPLKMRLRFISQVKEESTTPGS